MSEKLTEALTTRLGYAQEGAALVSGELEDLDARLRPLLDAWLEREDGSGDMEISGYSIRRLEEDYGMNFIAALLTLDWLCKEPEKALSALQEGIL